MKWTARFSKQSAKFLEKNSIDLFDDFVAKAIRRVVFKESINIDIKKMKGSWKGHYRIRYTDLRIILKFEVEEKVVQIYRIGWRGNVYK